MNPSNPGAIDMRHTKLRPEEAALIAGEVVKPSWASRNEGIHERISFEDTLWGFEMAGGAYYKTPLRVAYVRPDSRAEKACIRMGDTVLRINGQETSNLTLQEAHKLVLEAGINLKIVVTAPEDKVNAHYDYEDPLNESPGLTAEQLKQMEIERVRRALERASRCKELQWPWVRKNWTIYRESNCFMVPSKYENKHRDKFPELPAQKTDYFFPAQKTTVPNNKKKPEDNLEQTKVSKVENQGEEDVEEYEEEEEEVEEEIEEEVGEEEEDEENSKKDDVLRDDIKSDDNIERLESIETDKNECSSNQEENIIISESNLENKVKENSDESQRKDSGYISNHEVDNNNVSETGKQTNEHKVEQSSDDTIINEIADSSSELKNGKENAGRSDDDIIESVLNDNLDSKDTQNER